MKVVLILYICAALHGECIAPIELGTHDSYYNCLQAGYNEAIIRQSTIGAEETNKHQIYIRFLCKPVNEPVAFVVKVLLSEKVFSLK